MYKAHIIPKVGQVFAQWRDVWRRVSGNELYIACVQTDPTDHGYRRLDAAFDAVVEFPPHVVPATRHQYPYMMDNAYAGVPPTGHLFDYDHLVTDVVSGVVRSPRPEVTLYRAVMLAWDNAARRKEGWSVWYGFSLERYFAWLQTVIAAARHTLPPDRRMIFINAWNEWGEGTYLEPDRATGYASLNTTARALFGLPLHDLPRIAGRKPPIPFPARRIAVHFHIFFEHLIDETVRYLGNIPYPYDLFITTDTDAKAASIHKALTERGNQQKLFVERVQNTGRDVGPFLVSTINRLSAYDYIGHFHTKRSTTVAWGDLWREYLLGGLLGATATVESIFAEFENEPALGIVCPPAFPLIEPHLSWGDVKERCEDLLTRMNIDPALPDVPTFPAGNMFWARSAALRPMIAHVWRFTDFEGEAAQVGGTLAHCIERLWCIIAAAADFRSATFLNTTPRGAMAHSAPAPAKPVERLGLFVHYEANNTVSEADLHYLRALAAVTTEIVVISNAKLDDNSIESLRFYAGRVILRENTGFDFGAWRDGLAAVGWNNLHRFDEILFANNSCFGPFFPLPGIFQEMTARDCDCWGLTAFPDSPNSPRPEAGALPGRHIPYHLQSFFFVMKASAVRSDCFASFWGGVTDKDDLTDVVTSYEVRMTETFAKAGLTWSCYLPETPWMQKARDADPRFNLPYNQPYSLLTLGCPIVKKKGWGYSTEQMLRVRQIAGSLGYPPHFIRNDTPA